MKKPSTATRSTKKPAKTARHKSVVTSVAPTSFPIVGIGASAGGLEALDQFLGRVPTGSGMAFVIVQHLDPTRKGIMSELLQRATGMKVVQVKDRTPVQPDCVYVIPPNKDMSILHGVLHLLKPTATRGLRLPIDFFLRSLAQDQQEHSVGVILSGMGSDGTLGLRAIKEKAGVALVQEPTTAKFDSMPRSVIDAGLADIVAPAAELPGKILAYLQRTPLLARTEEVLEDKAQSALEKVVILLRAHTGNDFSFYKRNTLYRRIERRMGIHQIKKMAAYVRYLQENSQELDLLFKELLIGVTNFFRDPAAWEQLSAEAIPALLASRPPGKTLRAWVAGCSTGEEAYSLAIVFKEALEEVKPRGKFSIQIFATDLDRDAIEKARAGVFPANIAADISKARLKRFFTKEVNGYRVRKEIRELVIFAPHNLIMDPPFTKLDILSCRNLLIYLTTEVQKKLIPLFHYSLLPGGILFQGSAETVGDFTRLFAPLNAKSRLFRRTESVLRPEQVVFPSSFAAGLPVISEAPPAANPPASLQALADQLVLQNYAPPAVLTNDTGDIFYVSGRTGKYLEPAAGKANWNIFAMAREGLRYELVNAFKEALRKKESVTLHGLKIGTNGGTQCVDVTVRRLDESGPLQGLLMIVFTDVAAPVAAKTAGRPAKPHARSPRVAELEQELLQVRGESRATHEEMQTSQEELRSANEELQSTNEEMQSTNEELTTSKEEMQSMNEELQTVNTELQVKVDELSHASNDMKNLLDSTDIATLFLDKELNVRRFTPQATKIIKLIAGDAGRPITDLSSDLHYPELADDARAVLQKLAAVEKPISARDGRWFTVRIMPYRTLDDRIDGVVITFANITVSKTLEAKLREQHAVLQKDVADESAARARTSKLVPAAVPKPGNGKEKNAATPQTVKPSAMPTTLTIPAEPIPLRSEIKADLREFKAKHEFGPMMAELYRKAEAKLRKQKRQRKLKADEPKVKMDRADNRRLLHELQVHQVELEMQNTELQENRNRMEGMLEKYTDLYDFAPVGYFTLAASGTVQFVNLTGASLVGMERSKLVGQAFGRLFTAEQRAAFNSFLKQVFASPAKQSADFELARPGKPPKGVNLEAQRMLGGQECRAVMIDITGRKQAENEVRVSEIRYRRLFEAAHDGVLLIDPATRKITDANPFMTKLLGYPHDQLVGKELFEIGLLKDEAVSREMFQKLKIDHEIRYENLPLKSQDGRHQEVEVVANLYQENGHAVIQCNIRNITERKQTEQQLAEKARLLDLSHDAIIVRDMKGRIRYWNHGAEEIYGWSREEALGKISNVLLQTKYPIPLRQMTAELFRTDRWIGELLHTKRNGERITVFARKTLDRDDDGNPAAVLENITDITERKQAEAAQRRLDVVTASNTKLKLEIVRRQAMEKSLMWSEQHQRHLLGQARLLQEQLRQVSRQVLQAQEEERKRISRELHDVIAQTLAGINLRLAALKKEAGNNSLGFGRNITNTQRLVEKSVKLVHQFARELRPAVLDDLGLIPALHSFVKSFSKRTRIHVHLKVFAGVEKMDANRRTIFYRVVQEALTNVARHARAGAVEVSLQKLPGHVCLKIKDDGKSFNVKRVLDANGGKRLGLLGMRERLEMVGGTFAVESAPGQGTTIIAQIPLGQATRKKLAETKV